MTRAIAVTCTLLGLIAVVNGQGRGNNSQSPAKSPDTFDPSKNHVVVGCLTQAPNGGYMLANAVEVKGGTADPTSNVKKSYTLAGVIPPSLNLKPHLSHKVELSGSITDDTKFNMERFKMVSPTCP